MQIVIPLSELLRRGEVQQVLHRGSSARSYVRPLQVVLYGLGFGEELKWERYLADGDYGPSTARALRAFMAPQQVSGDGETVEPELLRLLLLYYRSLPALRAFISAKQNQRLQDTYRPVGDRWDDYQTLRWAARLPAAEAPPSEEEAAQLLQALRKRLGRGWENAWHETDGIDSEEAPQVYKPWWGAHRVSNRLVKGKFPSKNNGYYLFGEEAPQAFLSLYRSEFEARGLSDSLVRIMLPVSANEGRLDAINSYDNAFFTFGMFQWTLGVEDYKGELPALLQRIQQEYPDAFEYYYGRYGIEVDAVSGHRGYLRLNGRRVDLPSEKAAFRSLLWAFRFWVSGLDPRVQFAQVLHAMGRLHQFKHHVSYRPLGRFYIDELITSEYGMCLLLDHHVNRPGHLMNYSIGRVDILGQAMRDAGLDTSLVANWGDDEEARLIEAYLSRRYQSSMTHARSRARRIREAMGRGELSAQRHSFQMGESDLTLA